MGETAVDELRAIVLAGRSPSRREFEACLRELGLSSRLAKRVASLGVRGFGDEAALLDELRELSAKLDGRQSATDSRHLRSTGSTQPSAMDGTVEPAGTEQQGAARAVQTSTHDDTSHEFNDAPLPAP